MTHPVFENNTTFLRFPFDKERLGRWADELFQWLFCIHPRYAHDDIFLMKEIELKHSLYQFIKQTQTFTIIAKDCAEAFFNKLPAIHQLLKSDLEAMYNSDPGAKSIDEVLHAYPGFYAVSMHRLAHELWKAEIPVIPRLLSEYSHFKTGIDIHPAATIGERFLIDHGTGVVIGETSQIGNDVTIYQGVTLGALKMGRNQAKAKRHPTIGNRVVIYANATILGGNTSIGSDSIIGGNVWITQSVPPHSLVYHKSEITIKNNTKFPEPLDFII